jgi:hypothetical protein
VSNPGTTSRRQLRCQGRPSPIFTCHVQDQSGEVDRQDFHHTGHDATHDLFEPGFVDVIYDRLKAAVVERGEGNAHPAVTGDLGTPTLERRLPAGSHTRLRVARAM